MPRSSWLQNHVGSSSSHLPSLSRSTSSASVAQLASTPPTPSSGTFAQNLAASIPVPQTPWDENHNAYFPSTPASEGPYHGIHNIHGTSWLEIVLDHEHVILRGAGGDTNPASLSGRVVLHLGEATNVKEITLVLTGKAKVGFSDGSGSSTRSHAHTHLLIHHDWSFLTPAPGSHGKKPVLQNHTLKAGVHAFPFQLTIESDTTIPSSMRTWNNDAYVFYKLRACAHRSGAFSSNFQATKPVSILRTFTAEALEFTQTLEIENSWPMKVAYSLTLPHKAFAAGDTIPIAVKFQPLAKGVHITSISTVVKEYTLVHTKNSSHPDVRVAASIRHDIRNGRAYVHNDKAHQPAQPPPTPRVDPEESPAPTPSGGLTPARRSSVAAGVAAEGYFPSVPTGSSPAEQAALNGNVDHPVFPSTDPLLAGATPMDAQEAYLQSREENREVELGDGEIDTMISIPLPVWTTPSHAVHPVFVTHKIKWSCVISNSDGHTSELRCALPIHVLAAPLAEEAHTASASTTALLFGLSGDAQAEVQQLELPSYSNHVYDRVANASVTQTTGAAVAAPWSSSRNGSPSGTPPTSRPGSRPGSPVLGRRSLSTAMLSSSSLQNSGTDNSSLVDDQPVPERPHLNWADSELLLSLGQIGLGNHGGSNHSGSGPNSHSGSPHRTPPDSRAPSRSASRSGGFRGLTSSRPSSRPSSPERERSGTVSPGQNGSDSASMNGDAPRGALSERRGSAGLFHMPMSMKPFTPFAHKRGQHSTSGSHENSPLHSPSLLYPNHQPSIAPMGGNGRFSLSNSPIGSRNASSDDVAALSQVPSYNIASRGFLGGGVVPLSAVQGLPDYDESESLQRSHKSETNLLDTSRNAGPPGSLENSHASSSALATSLSTTAEAGTLASPVDIPLRPRFDDDEEDEDHEDDSDALAFNTKKSRAARSPSVSTLMPNRP